ncbi:MAG: DUF2892 domain-containing protein [Alphaproteobacteria bacterium]|nr:DUF2892 domain-containing protein [Alphaproteobacteria bacterium]
MFGTNLGSADRAIRAIVGVALIAVYFMYPDLTNYKWAALIIGLVLLFTAVMSSCAIYRVLGISTSKKTSDEK